MTTVTARSMRQYASLWTMRLRVEDKFVNYYELGMADTIARLKRWQSTETALAAVGAVLAALAAALGVKQLSAWVAVTTTLAALVAVHAASRRLQEQVEECSATHQAISDLLDEAVGPLAPEQEDQIVQRFEDLILSQHGNWAKRWAYTGDQT